MQLNASLGSRHACLHCGRICATLFALCAVLGCRRPSTRDPTEIQDFVFTDHSTIFVSSTIGDVVRSDDSGQSWRTVASYRTTVFRNGIYMERLAAGRESLWAIARPYVLGPFIETLVSTDGGSSFSAPPGEELVAAPVELISRKDAEPYILDYTGQMFSVGTGETAALAIRLLGFPNPDGSATKGAECNDRVFVASTRSSGYPTFISTVTVWSSDNLASSWTSEIEFAVEGDVIAFSCAPTGELWLVTVNGFVYRRDPGDASWEQIARAPGASFALASDGGRAFVGGFREVPKAAPSVVEVLPDGRLTTLPEPPGDTVRSLRFDSDGRLWAGSRGIHRFDSLREVWQQMWP